MTQALTYRYRFKSIHLVSGIVLFWGLSDALISFYLPIQMERAVQNLTLFGILFAFSSLVGAFADPVLGFLSNKVRYTGLLLVGLLLSLALVVLANAQLSLAIVIVLMALWGLYYEFINIGIFNYVSRYHSQVDQSRYFGSVYLLEDVAYVIGPLTAGFLVFYGNRAIYGFCMVFIALALTLLPQIITLHKHRERPLFTYVNRRAYSLKQQLKSYRKVWGFASVFLVAALLYNVWDAFIWTLVPLGSIAGSAIVAGIITSTFVIPQALFSGYGGQVADRFGRKITFVVGLFVASLCTMLFGLQGSIILRVIMAALSSLGFAFAYPALMGETAKDGQDHLSELGNIAGVQRLFVNAGFIIGPITAGLLASAFGLQRAFFVLGIAMLICFIPIVITMIHFHLRGRIHRTVTAEFDL